MSKDGQGIKWRRNIAQNFSRLSSVRERYRQTDNRHAEGRVDLLVLILYISICTIYNVRSAWDHICFETERNVKGQNVVGSW